MKKPLRVLVIEDSPDDAELLLLELRRASFIPHALRVQTAADLATALEKGCDGEMWDVLIADYSMPGFSAPAALEVLKSKGLDLPFIIVSGSVGEDIAVLAMKAGAHDFFVKGHLTRLPAAIEREMREARLRRESSEARRTAEAERERLLGELRQAVKVREEFLSIASHELNTPITSLKLHIDNLLSHPDREVNKQKMSTKLTAISRQVNRLVQLVNNLLNVTRLTSGRLNLNREDLDLNEVVQAVLSQLKPLAEQARSDFHFHGQAARGKWDHLGIETVVTNLLTNALKYGEHRPIEINVTNTGTHAELTVQDHGIGITLEDQQRIFGRFERAIPDQAYEGLGLGLWIARRLVEEHGGMIHVKSEPHNGSTFRVELPL